MAPRFNQWLRRWAQLWGLPGLEEAVTVVFSARLSRSVARCDPTRGRIVLASGLRDAPARALRTVLCHEAAHVAAFHLHGNLPRAHGPEWAALVRAAGSRPTVRVLSPWPAAHNQANSATTFRFEHRCPVCHNVRWAKRRVRAWRCADCVAAGLSGEMVVSDLTSAPGAA
jgi:predicted SprT family Zn-dependent metalloprotease